MSYLKQLINFEYESEYDNQYDLPLKLKFSTPKISNSNGDLTKRWYVYYSYRDPVTDKMKRMNPIYGGANKYHNKEDRMTILTGYRRVLIRLLKEGFSPFEENLELYKARNAKKEVKLKVDLPVIEQEVVQKVVPEVVVIQEKIEEPIGMDFDEALDFVLVQKKKYISNTGKSTFLNRIKDFRAWVKTTYPELKSVVEISKMIMLTYLNHILDRTSPRTRNNYKADLSSVFQVLENNEIIPKNVVMGIPKIKTKPKRNRTYTLEQTEEIFDYLIDVDPILLLYIKFISYNLLRPIEVCRLKLKDIDFVGRKLQFQAKNSPLKTKIIPKILFEELGGLDKLDGELLLFTPDKIGGEWNADLRNRRDHFSKRFKVVVKNHFKLGINYTMYSFRHTFITKLYRKLVEGSTPHEAKSKLMLITGHASMEALEKYLRDIDAQLPADYSDLLKSDG